MEISNMMRILITGATSFIGAHLVNELLNNGCKVYAVIRPNSPNTSRLSKHENLYIIEKSLEELSNLQDDIKETIDVLYHLAWDGTRVPQRDDKQLQEKNYKAAIEAFKLSIFLGCKKFIGVGSQAEYGKTYGDIKEDYLAKPLTEYGKSKLKSYITLSNIAEQNNIEFVWTRIFSVYGKYDYEKTLIMSTIQNLSKDDSANLTKCEQNWNYLYVKDAARMLSYLGLQKCELGIYNLASLDNRELKDYLLELKKIMKSKGSLEFGSVAYNSEGIVSLTPCIDKFLRNFIDFKFTQFKDGVSELLLEMKE